MKHEVMVTSIVVGVIGTSQKYEGQIKVSDVVKIWLSTEKRNLAEY